MEQSRATRSDLLARKSQVALASQGAKLLKSKREALMKELMSLIRPLVDAYSTIPEHAQHAARSLTLSEAMDGTAYLRSTAMLARDPLHVQHKKLAFWGVRLPVIEADSSRSAEGLRSAGLSSSAMEAANDFHDLLSALLRAAPLQVRLSRLGCEIRKTSRRVNALDQVVIPNLHRDIASISQALEEIEREDLFRLRRIKRKKEKKRQ